MKKLISFLVLACFILTLFSASDAAVKKRKKTVKKRRYHYRRIVRNWPKGGPRPVFPKSGADNSTKAAPPPPSIKQVLARPADPPPRDCFFAEGGLAGGGGALEIGYARSLNEKLNLSGALGFTFFSNNNGVVLDLVRAAYNINNIAFAGAGLGYARNIPGVELFAGRHFDRWSVRAGYSGALGFRLAAAYRF